MYEFPCPNCQARLRLRDLGLLGREMPCPDCGTRLKIVRKGDGLQGVVATAGLEPRGPVSRAGQRPVLVGWLVAVGLVIVIGAVLLLTGGDEESLPPETATVETDEPAPAVVEEPKEEEEPEVVVESPAPDRPPAPEEIARERMQRIGHWLDAYHGRHGAYPQESAEIDVSEGALGWHARLVAAEVRPQFPVQWDRPWQDPLNDRFVRRRIETFLNPVIDLEVGREGYPAAHFVGLAGVGGDAGTLPKKHPRAGAFGYSRKTTRDDLVDGLSVTALLAGVTSPLASWAASSASIRPLTQEPYVNGPDGFGTGQPDGMLVLMADGSVKLLPLETDPEVMRRLVTIADGKPVDLDSLTRPAVPQMAEGPMPPPPRVDDAMQQDGEPRLSEEPIEVPLAPSLPAFDLEGILETPLLAFTLPEPQPLRTVLRQLEELIGVPIDATGVDAQLLERPIELTLEKTSIGGVLDAVLDDAGLAYREESRVLRLYAPQSDED